MNVIDPISMDMLSNFRAKEKNTTLHLILEFILTIFKCPSNLQ